MLVAIESFESLRAARAAQREGVTLEQSDGQSATDRDPLINQHVTAGSPLYLEVEAIAGSGPMSLTTTLTTTTEPFATLPASTTGPMLSPIAVGDFNSDGLLDYVTSAGVALNLGDGIFSPPTGPLLPTADVVSAIVSGPIHERRPDRLRRRRFQHRPRHRQCHQHRDDLPGQRSRHVPGGADDRFAGGRQPLGPGRGRLHRIGRPGPGRRRPGPGRDGRAVLLYQGLGDGTFQPQPVSTTTVGQLPAAIVSGDFNGQGDIDLAVANNSSNTVTILLNDGAGTFTTQTVPVGVQPEALAVGPFTGPGYDLAVLEQGNEIGYGSVSILTGSPTAHSPSIRGLL